MRICFVFVSWFLAYINTSAAGLVQINNENVTKTWNGTLQQRIFGGSQAGIEAIPYQGLYRTSSSTICGCTLISKRWVVTAAHCTKNTPVSQMFITFGTNNRVVAASTSQSFTVTKKIEHPNYSSETQRNDITLLFLSSEVEITSYVQTIDIPPQGADVTVGKVCSITGWGTVEDGSNPRLLREAHVPVISNQQCQSWLGITGTRIVPAFLCAGFEGGGVDTCLGDSGGPLACRNDDSGKLYLQGVTSFGFGCAQARRPGVYTRVSEFSDWISQNAGVARGTTIPVTNLYKTVLLSLSIFVITMSAI